MMRWQYGIVGVAVAVLLAAGCGKDKVPERSVEFENSQDAVRSFYDYRRLENAGVETIQLKSRHLNRTVSMAFYLYIIAQAFEDFGREGDAAKLYLRLLTNYPLLHEGGQLGIMAENRLRWLIGDKSWVVSSVDELILRLEAALQQRDAKALKRLISRDFGFGRSASDRFAVQYKEGLGMITSGFEDLKGLTVEVAEKIGEDQITLKTSGWEAGTKIWYLTLHRNNRLRGWEWDMAYWENNEKP